jgi:aspartate-semialdehyde dehydrogenase
VVSNAARRPLRRPRDFDDGCDAAKTVETESAGRQNRRRDALVSYLPSSSPAGFQGEAPLKGDGEGNLRDKDHKIMGFKVAVVGATGNVGREMLGVLAERRFPVSEIVALASSRSVGTDISFGEKVLKCRNLENYDFSTTDICLMSAGGVVSKEWSPKIGAQGCLVIDNSSAWRYDQSVPLIVPEVNAEAAKGFGKRNIIANPNCSTAQLVVALKPLHDKAKIRRVVVATYQSVSGAGKEATDELFAQTRAVFVSDPVTPKKFPKRIAFNVIPQIDVFMEDGFTREEWKMVAETKKILDPQIKLVATCVRVPVFIGHSEAVNIEFENPISADEAREILRGAPGCLVIDRREDGGYMTPHEAVGDDATYISRIREDPTIENGLVLWCVSDNLRKGAALNAVQIAELLVNRGWLKPKQKAA